MKTRIITTAVIKGGTGKTSTAAAIAQAAVKDGKTALVIDLDPQANLSFCLGADLNTAGSYQLLNGATPQEAIQQTPQGIFCSIGSPNLAEEKTTPASALRLKNILEPIKSKFDFIIIDTPPQLGELTYNAIYASDIILIPLEADNYSLQGFYQLINIADILSEKIENKQEYRTVITRYDGRPNINKFYKNAIEKAGKEYGAPLIGTIRKGVAVPESQAFCASIFEDNPKSKPALDYWALYEKLKRL